MGLAFLCHVVCCIGCSGLWGKKGHWAWPGTRTRTQTEKGPDRGEQENPWILWAVDISHLLQLDFQLMPEDKASKAKLVRPEIVKWGEKRRKNLLNIVQYTRVKQLFVTFLRNSKDCIFMSYTSIVSCSDATSILYIRKLYILIEIYLL